MPKYVPKITTISMVALMGINGCASEKPDSRCTEAVASLKSYFNLVCESKSDRTLHNGSLESIIEKRDEILNYEGCHLNQRWWCSRGSYFGKNNGNYIATSNY
ncbi:MAG: hypothetical protein ABH824_06065 [Nanoarchaeota archaeon]|nr:hypothetical protein [Nanoarchaeota archaeon]